MAALIGYLQGNRGEVSRCGSKNSGISANLETWKGSIRVVLSANGNCHVMIGSKHSPSKLVYEGNVDVIGKEMDGY